MVPVQPNAACIRGKIVSVRAEENGATWEVAVSHASDVEGMPNFAQSEVGKNIRLHVHAKLETRVAPTDSIEAQVAFRGDEHGGRFVLANDAVRKL